MGFEYFYGFVAATVTSGSNLFRNTTQIYPFLGKGPGTWNLVTAMADDAIDWMTRINGPDPANRSCWYAPGAPMLRTIRQGVGGQDRRHASMGRRLEQGTRTDFRQPEAAGRDPQGHQADAMAKGRSERMGPRCRPTRRSSTSARPMFSPRTRHDRPRDRRASSRRSRIWASSTTR